jgi:hypothetical protein
MLRNLKLTRSMAMTMLDSIYGHGQEPAEDFVNNASIFVDRLALAFQPSREYNIPFY